MHGACAGAGRGCSSFTIRLTSVVCYLRKQTSARQQLLTERPEKDGDWRCTWPFCEKGMTGHGHEAVYHTHLHPCHPLIEAIHTSRHKVQGVPAFDHPMDRRLGRASGVRQAPGLWRLSRMSGDYQDASVTLSITNSSTLEVKHCDCSSAVHLQR